MKRAALFIGVNEYQAPLKVLSCAREDAAALYQLFLKEYSNNLVHFLQDPDSDEMIDKLEYLTGELSAGDLLLVYFSGHGVEIQGNHYLLSSKAKCIAGHWRHAITMDMLKELTRKNGVQTVFILDSCREHTFTGTRNANVCAETRSVTMKRLVEQKEEQGFLPPVVFCSCSGGEMAFEVEKLHHGIFTLALLDALNKKRSATLDDLTSSVTLKINDLMKEHQLTGQQTPEVIKNPLTNPLIWGGAASVDNGLLTPEELITYYSRLDYIGGLIAGSAKFQQRFIRIKTHFSKNEQRLAYDALFRLEYDCRLQKLCKSYPDASMKKYPEDANEYDVKLKVVKTLYDTNRVDDALNLLAELESIQQKIIEKEKQKRQAEDQCKEEEAKRQAEDQRKAEEAKRQAEDQRKAEEVKRQIEEWYKAEEAKRQAEDQRKAEEVKRQAEEWRRAKEAERQAEIQRQIEEWHKAEEAKRQAEDQRKAEEAKRQAEEWRKAKEAERQDGKPKRKPLSKREQAAEEVAAFPGMLEYDVIKMSFVRIPAGSFLMGSPANELGRLPDEKQHTVTLTQDYWIGKFPVTQFQWQIVMEYNPSQFHGGNQPVENVNWMQAKAFCDRLNKIYPGKFYKFDLPTEAQWEYACRAMTTAALNNNTNLTTENGCCTNLQALGWYDKNSGNTSFFSGIFSGTATGKETHPIGLKKPNAWDIYDMHGNVHEWCRDWYGNYRGDEIDPTGPANGSYRVCRGGNWDCAAQFCRSAARRSFIPENFDCHLGFRIAFVPVQ